MYYYRKDSGAYYYKCPKTGALFWRRKAFRGWRNSLHSSVEAMMIKFPGLSFEKIDTTPKEIGKHPSDEGEKSSNRIKMIRAF